MTDEMKSRILDAAIIVVRCCGAIFSSYLILLGLMLIIGGPDGGAPLESRIIGAYYFTYSLICAFCLFVKYRFILNKIRQFSFLYALLFFPLAFLLYKDHDTITISPSPFVAYISAVAVFALVLTRSGWTKGNRRSNL